jgi:hypothetical protein
MVEVRDSHQAQFTGRCELAQEYGERHRVRPARHRSHYPGIGAKQRVLANELPDALQQHHFRAGMLGNQDGRVRGRGACCPPLPPTLASPRRK